MTNSDFMEVYEKYNFHLVLFSKKMVGDLLGEDFVQEAFAELWLSKNEHTNIRSFLFTCVYNKCLNHIKSQKRRTKINTLIWKTSEVSSDYIEQHLIRGEKTQRIIAEINKMPPQRQKIMKLFYDDFSLMEIAQILDITPSTVSVSIKYFIDNFEKYINVKPEERPPWMPLMITYNNKTKNIKQWAKTQGLNYSTVLKRIRKGLAPERALELGVQKRHRSSTKKIIPI